MTEKNPTQALLDAKERFQDNWKGYLREFRIWLLLVFITGTADMASTVYFMTQHGAEWEVHPAVRFVCSILGPYLGPVIGKICQYIAILAVTVYFRRQAVFVFIPVIVLYGWAAWYNVWGSQLYYPRLLQIVDWLTMGF